MSWLFSRALVVEYLGENFSDGEQSVQSSGNNIPQAYCAPDKMTGFSRLSRFGMTYAVLTESRGEELLTLYLEAFHAPTSVPQEKEQELTENSLECGEKWRGSFTKYNPDSSSWKTAQCSLLGDLDEFSETWPRWGLMRDGECWEQQTLAQTINVIVFGLNPNEINHPPPHIYIWTTPTAHMSKETNAPSEHRRNTPTLTAQVNQRWPTPTVCGNYNRKGASATSGDGLATAVQNWPTPDASAHKYRLSGNSQQSNSLMALAGGKLNPDWTEWLMGWPPGWTDLKPLEMDKSPCVPQQHGKYSVKESND
jgi:hypothetical protein